MKNNIDQIFKNHLNWDLDEPNSGHKNRFLLKLKTQKPKKNKQLWISLSIAAALIFGFGIMFFNTFNLDSEVELSLQVQQNQDYFSSVINSELKNLKKNKNPQTIIIIEDALKEMEVLEKDYEDLKKEVEKNGENKQIIFAMITNMQTRISFIKNVFIQVEQINKIKTNKHEQII
ncbi:hypothetical protein [uncultured Flavobacterium sp.]|uniref:hypothetical protein n=1 Tax=uncultured Flavobacterium sp. TaxID=165435 RepID=UPI0030CA460B|tara:strand:+ start:1270 stop:1794 length:525 start_codon:yes stop_codon:yes gene_type:complete